MQFIEFEKRIEKHSMWMNAPHSHEYYELYFLRKGERSLFVESAMFSVPENTFFAIPPYLLHKTEGRGYERININISPSCWTRRNKPFCGRLEAVDCAWTTKRVG